MQNTIDQIRATLSLPVDDSAKIQFITLLVDQYQPETKKNASSNGFVYLIKNEATGHVKIGFSGNPEQRLEQLKTGCPDAVLIHKFAGTIADEKTLHSLLDSFRIKREWFFIDDKAINLIHDYFNGEDLSAIKKDIKSIDVDVSDAVYMTILKNAENGIAQSHIIKNCAAYRRLSIDNRMNVIDKLISDGYITEKKNTTGSGGCRYFPLI